MHTPPHTVPGAFSFSYPQNPKEPAPPRLSGAKSHIFQPPRPRTPTISASSSLILTRSATSAMSTEYQHIPNAGRKRTRLDYNDGRQTPEPQRGGDPGSPQPFVNTRYLLKGGMDTPTLKAAQLHENGVDYLDVGYRRDSGLLEEETPGYQSFLPLELEREANGRARRSTSLSPGDGWSKAAFEVVGGVVGKVWEFCKKGAFRGFHAGADKGYTLSNEGNSFVEESWMSEKITTSWGNERESTPLPGQFPDEDFIPDYWDSPAPEASPQRPGKRRQIGDNKDELARNWVVVQPQLNDRPQTPTKPQPRPQAGAARYSMPTASSASRRARPASRAGAGAVLSNAPRRPLINRVSHAGSPALQSSQPASYASPRSPHSSKIPRAVASPGRAVKTKDSLSNLDSPAAKEAQRWAALKKREEIEADITMRRMDKQLKDMIRQGKEALGTRIEIEIEDDYKTGISRPGPKKWGV